MSVGFRETSIEFMDLPTNLSTTVPLAIDDCSLAFHLGIRNKSMWYILLDTAKHYNVIKIAKRSGGVRIIHDPSTRMKWVLRQAHIKFLQPLQEKLGDHVTAYRKGISARMAVERHIPHCPTCASASPGNTPTKHDCPHEGMYIHMDLKDFFPSTSAANIRNYLKHQVGYNHTVAGYLANLLTVRDIPNPRYHSDDPNSREFFAGTPQGSPASGAMCNLVADATIDRQMLGYIKQLNTELELKGEWQWCYSRYSDDMTFTCGITPTEQKREEILNHLKGIVYDSGYRLNPKKTKVVYGRHRKRLLGIVFNQKPNFAKEEYLRLRAIVHNCRVNGFETQFTRAGLPSADAMVSWLRGKINWVNQINPDKGEKLLREYTDAHLVYEGGLNGSTPC